ncbi:hypothetical protein KORDIASMS9_00015 [Kordia sp. SMS9]|uniref:hypothetical protein n=1 Tax=Kordia sp. SMS9 TaxID=2282170 RepID=UPI000E0CD1D8|nr:hypothetical protein [Kordia sp. SMS9]AXG67833.1 hypothetical protein KORDIASMS9_00015 [Kordia sp. SMS9]
MKTTKTVRLLFTLCLLFLYSCENKDKKQSNETPKTESTTDLKKSATKQEAVIVAKMEKDNIVLTNKKQVVQMLEKRMKTDQFSRMDMNTLEIDVSKALMMKKQK